MFISILFELDSDLNNIMPSIPVLDDCLSFDGPLVFFLSLLPLYGNIENFGLSYHMLCQLTLKIILIYDTLPKPISLSCWWLLIGVARSSSRSR